MKMLSPEIASGIGDHGGRTVEGQRIARFSGDVEVGCDDGLGNRQQRQMRLFVDLGQRDHMCRIPAPGDGFQRARHAPAVARAQGGEVFGLQVVRDGKRPVRRLQAGLRQQPTRQQCLHQRRGGGELAGGVHDDEHLVPARAHAALVLGRERKGQAVLFQRGPERVREAAVLRPDQAVARDEIAEQPGHGLPQDVFLFAHRRPSPRAMMPRTTSRVPPRSEKETDACVT